ncbi:MAG: TlpA family protein disulfide reductase [Mesorhizobium sp.]|uniref:thiol:disulfide interchange protein TlpA n=1 Tax=Mesorhizobium sp. TaxID=1871066 RepID=UPI000FE67ED8|nr:TlpA disulfide reductase family protein [Mesorhizobium sp.]RWM02584.1 MAG: TlpA family protein disulfide reductase [Mesorhizobium sp.]TIO48172.1 MAG: TlpA family protein disulfide reductase [Mesorhizobium sp.]TIO56580.1 MAG: TlpA family protein disulfide reductase [Mesorhizobium sp.]TJV58019.1 MAG: TlpA family protein disulfide reductase [Mesorhizobium sp.]
MADGNRFFPAPRLILAALAAGVLAGAVAVYVSESGSGNNAPPQAAAADGKDDVACKAKAGRAKQVAAKAVGQVAALRPADPPQSLKSLAFNGPDGKPMTVADHAGKTVLLNLWATWCAPCRAEMPALDALQKEKGSNTFEVVAVNVDTGDDAKPKKFLKEIGVETLGYYRDSTMGLFNEAKTRGLALGLPVTMLIDDEGCLIAHMNGPAEWSSADAKRLVEAALGP